MVELKMDVDQLRREFERYRERLQDPRSGRTDASYMLLPRGPESVQIGTLAPEDTGPEQDRGGAPPVASRRDDFVEDPGHDGQDGGGVTFRPGMTMEELEREAIRAVLREMDGNRRKAAESLGIGERTLYRKIRKFGIEE
jgi:transcriptional regulator of acetoin/glycerol metabolism